MVDFYWWFMTYWGRLLFARSYLMLWSFRLGSLKHDVAALGVMQFKHDLDFQIGSTLTDLDFQNELSRFRLANPCWLPDELDKTKPVVVRFWKPFCTTDLYAFIEYRHIRSTVVYCGCRVLSVDRYKSLYPDQYVVACMRGLLE